MGKYDLQVCDDRRYLQKLTATLISKFVKFKDSACKETSRRISEFIPGEQSVNICNLATPAVLNEITAGNQNEAVDLLIVNLGYPRATRKLITQGAKSLTPAEKKELTVYLVKEGREYASEQVIPEVEKFIAEKVTCPTKERTLAIIESTNRVKTNLLKIQNTVNWLNEGVLISYSIVTALTQLNKATKLTLTLIPTPPPGIPGLAGITQWLSEQIQNNKTNLKELEKDLCDASNVLTYISTQLNLIITFLTVVDLLLQQCLLEDLQNLSPVEVQALNLANYNRIGRNVQSTYRDYTLEIRTDENSPTLATRRYAVALDAVGVVILRGPSSFSSNTEVLIEELKFRIDNHLG